MRTLQYACLFLLIVLLCTSLGFGQTSTFKMNFGERNSLQDMVATPNGNYIMCGRNDSLSFFAEFDQDGQLQWAKSAPAEYAWQRLFPRPDGKVYAVGGRTLPNLQTEIVAGLYSANGQNIWLRGLDSANSYAEMRGAVLGNGNLMVVGTGDGNPNTTAYLGVLDMTGALVWQETLLDMARGSSVVGFGLDNAMVAIADSIGAMKLMRIGSTGNIIWAKAYETVRPMELTLRGDSLLYMGAIYNNYEGNTALCVFDTLGDHRWTRVFGDTQGVGRISFLPTGDLVIAGYIWINDFMLPISKSGYAFYHPTTNAFAQEGVREWQDASSMTRPLLTADNGILVAYQAYLHAPGYSSLFMEKVDMNLSTACDSAFGSSYTPGPLSFSSTHASIVPVAAGPMHSLLAHPSPAYVLELHVDCSSTVGIAEPMLPTLSAWPNPFADRLQINWQHEAFGTAAVELQVWNANGQILRRDRVENAGSTALTLEGLPRGMYWVRLVGDGSSTHVTVVKE